MVMLHKYLVLDIEVNAVRKWLWDINRLNEVMEVRDSETNFFRKMQSFVIGINWKHYEFRKIHPASKTEKIMYLYHHQSLGMNKIQAIVGSSPNYINKVIKTNSFKRHYQEDHELNLIIEQWEPFKALIPKEIFVKYI